MFYDILYACAVRCKMRAAEALPDKSAGCDYCFDVAIAQVTCVVIKRICAGVRGDEGLVVFRYDSRGIIDRRSACV